LPPLPEKEALSVVASLAKKERRKPPGGRGAKIPRNWLGLEVSWPAKVLVATSADLAQTWQPRPKNADLADYLGVVERSVNRWRKELRRVGLWGEIENVPCNRFVVVPPGLLTDPSLPVEAKATALVLASLAREGEAQVGMKALCKGRGLKSRWAVKQHLEQLETAGYLRICRAPFDKELGRRKRCTQYTFLEKQCEIDK
jgi:hypothetical protein